MNDAATKPRVAIGRWLPHLPLLTALAGAVFTILVFYPGFMSNDSFAQMEQARSGVLTDSHPPLLAVFWMVAEFFVVGPFLMLVGQVGLVYSGLYVVSRHVTTTPLRRSALLFLVTAYPPTFSILGTIWKDVWMVGFLLWAVHLALQARRAGRPPWGWSLSALAAAGLAVGMRHNAIAAALPIAVLAVWCLLRTGTRSPRVRFGASVLGGVVTSLALFGLVNFFNSAVVDESESFWQVLADFDLAGISVRTGELQVPAHRMRPGATLDDVEERYWPRYQGPLYRAPCEGTAPECEPLFRRSTDDRLLDDLRERWFGALSEHPGAYLEHRTAVYREVVGLTEGPVWSPFYDERFSLDGPWVGPPSRFAAKMASIYERLGQTPLYTVWAYLLALMAVAPWLGTRLLRAGGREFVLESVLVSSGLLYAASYFPLAPSPDYRYTHWAVLCSLVVAFRLVLLLLARHPRTESTDAVPLA